MAHVFDRCLALCLALAFAATAGAQGIVTKRSAAVLFGSAAQCSQPASIDLERVRKRTPEWKTIRAEGVRKDSARYNLLMSEMSQRIQRACKKVGEENARDCIVDRDDIVDDRGLEVVDLTDEVVDALESVDGSP